MTMTETTSTQDDGPFAREKAALVERRDRIEKRQGEISWFARTFNAKAKTEYKTNKRRLFQISRDMKFYNTVVP